MDREKRVIDCGDNSCRFATEHGGMRTNGGCRCLYNAGFPESTTKAFVEMFRELLELRDEVKRLEGEREKQEMLIVGLYQSLGAENAQLTSQCSALQAQLASRDSALAEAKADYRALAIAVRKNVSDVQLQNIGEDEILASIEGQGK